jgi:uncharacterized protein (UPF0335 family)
VLPGYGNRDHVPPDSSARRKKEYDALIKAVEETEKAFNELDRTNDQVFDVFEELMSVTFKVLRGMLTLEELYTADSKEKGSGAEPGQVVS